VVEFDRIEASLDSMVWDNAVLVPGTDISERLNQTGTENMGIEKVVVHSPSPVSCHVTDQIRRDENQNAVCRQATNKINQLILSQK